MEFIKYLFIVISVIYFLIILLLGTKSKKVFKYIILNSFMGLSVFFILYFLKNFTGIILYLNPITLSFSTIYGIVGVIGMLILNLII